MKISLNLIKQFTDLKIEESELIERISSRIGEIESIEHLGPKYQQLVIGRIDSAQEHPDADKLGVYQVEIGADSPVQVVAGDRNLKSGDYVCYIPPGATVPATIEENEPLVIAKRELRGQLSNGMLASAKELGLGQDHSGVLVLDSKFEPGTAFAECYELNDTIIEIENKALTHRGDTFGHIGFAREVAGIQQLPFNSPDWFKSVSHQLEVEGSGIRLTALNNAPEHCRRLTLMGLSDINKDSAPLLIQSYLSRLGVRPLGAVVDITNYLMLISGQPMHAFDYDKLLKLSTGGDAVKLQVRLASAGEELSLLGGNNIKLSPEDLVIATDAQAVSLAGVMGGADSEVDESTTRIVLEVANFNMYTIRGTSMRHGLFTDAVTRFSRGIDPLLCLPVQYRAAEMLAELCGAKVATEVQDVFSEPMPPAEISVNANFINNRLGADIEATEMAKILSAIEIGVNTDRSDLQITPPSWRSDLTIAEDIVEEIGRLSGYDNLPVTLPTRSVKPTPITANQRVARQIAEFLSTSGGNEVLSYSGVSGQLLAQAGQDSAKSFAIKNALSPRLEFMRQSLVPSLLEKVYPNLRQGYEQSALFEIGTTHHKDLMSENLPAEQSVVCWVTSASKKSQRAERHGAVYFEAAHTLRALLKRLGVSEVELQLLADSNSWLETDPWLKSVSQCFAAGRSAVIVSENQQLGIVGEFTPSVRRAFKLPDRSAGFELNRGRLLDLPGRNQKTIYHPIPRYPKVESDMTLGLSSQKKYQDIEAALHQALSQTSFEYRLEPLDIWQAETDSRRYTFRIWLWHPKRTLTKQEANDALDQVAQALAQDHQAQRV